MAACRTVRWSALPLVVIRGNSGSGKRSVARSLRAQAGRGVALVELSDRPLGVRDVRSGVGC
ncbi:hypothetical protein KBI5_19735 [Frankia sp. KB5]|nr:hypothetical protein KBI5_19735 [Frankia sp. KB5]